MATEHGCTRIAIEATGTYWRPVWHILSDGEFTLILANAAHVKNVPGRKADVADAIWLADLLAHGLIRPSFVPDTPTQEMRALLRTRKQLVREQASHVQRMQKTLEDANLKLSSVLTNIMGVSGRAIIAALIAGQTDPDHLLTSIQRGVGASPEKVKAALTVRMTDRHRFRLRLHLRQIDALDAVLGDIDTEVDRGLDPFREAVRLLRSIPGVSELTAQVIVSEIGTDMGPVTAKLCDLAIWGDVFRFRSVRWPLGCGQGRKRMQRLWSAEELGKRWSLLPEDLALLARRVDAGKLGFAVQLAFWRQHCRFPDEEADVVPALVAHLAAQISVGADALDGYAWAGRSGRRPRVAIIDHLAVAAFDEAAEARFRRWLADDALPREFTPAALDDELSAWFARSRVTRPGAYRMGRILRPAQSAHDDAALQWLADRLDAGMRDRLGALLADDGDGTAYAHLAADPGRVGLKSLLAEIAKLDRLRALALPSDLLRGLHPDHAKRFRRRAAVESAWELRRHPECIRLPLLAFWCAPREAEVVDGLVELLIQVTHRITVKAERRVVDELVEEAREVRGKAGILFRVVWTTRKCPSTRCTCCNLAWST